MPVYVLSVITNGHPESAAKICIFEQIHCNCIKCGISNSLILFYFAWWVWKYIKACNIIQIQALGVVIPFNMQFIMGQNIVLVDLVHVTNCFGLQCIFRHSNPILLDFTLKDFFLAI